MFSEAFACPRGGGQTPLKADLGGLGRPSRQTPLRQTWGWKGAGQTPPTQAPQADLPRHFGRLPPGTLADPSPL